MDITVVLVMGLITGLSLLCTVGSFIGGVKSVAKNAKYVDVGMTIFYMGIFAGGSTEGTAIALVAGATSLISTQALRRYWNWAASRGYLEPLNEKPTSKLDDNVNIAKAHAAKAMNTIYRKVA